MVYIWKHQIAKEPHPHLRPPRPKWKKLGLFGCMLSRLIGWKWTQFLIVLITTLILGYWQGHEMQGCASINYQVFFFSCKNKPKWSGYHQCFCNIGHSTTYKHIYASWLPPLYNLYTCWTMTKWLPWNLWSALHLAHYYFKIVMKRILLYLANWHIEDTLFHDQKALYTLQIGMKFTQHFIPWQM